MKLLIKTLVVVISVIFITTCDTTEPPLPPPPPEEPKVIFLKLATVSCTEAFITITANDTLLPVNITLNKDDTVLFNFTLSNKDTTVIDTTLQANKTYTYQATAEINGETKKSDTLQVKTLNTTSHNFTWQTYTFGNPNYGSSALSDVAVIDENNIWAVGEIFNDTTGKSYNAVHWDGSKWELKRVSVEHNGNIITPPLYGIFSYSSTDIWLSSGVPVHGDGTNWTQYHLFDMGILGQNDGYLTKIWGNSTDDLYYVGTLGTIVHYLNGSWSKIESGTTTNINEVWGINDSAVNNSLVLCTVSSRYHLGDYKLLSISGNTATEYFSWPYTRLYGIWFNSPQNIYIVGSGAYVYKNSNLKTINLPTNYFLTRVKGNALNDIYISTSDAVIFHYNGINWNEMSNGIYGKYEGMDVKGNTIALVGYNIEGGIIGKAVVTIGTHYK